MSGKRAKRLRRQVYGDALSPVHRTYTQVRPDRWSPGTRVADAHRRAYQRCKRAWTRRKAVPHGE